MKRTIGIAVIVGLVVGVVTGILFKVVPVLDNLIPDNYKSIVIGAIAGGTAVLFSQKSAGSKDHPKHPK